MANILRTMTPAGMRLTVTLANILRTMTLSGKMSDGGFAVGGLAYISLGSPLSVYTDRNMFTLTVLEISQISAK